MSNLTYGFTISPFQTKHDIPWMLKYPAWPLVILFLFLFLSKEKVKELANTLAKIKARQYLITTNIKQALQKELKRPNLEVHKHTIQINKQKRSTKGHKEYRSDLRWTSALNYANFGTPLITAAKVEITPCLSSLHNPKDQRFDGQPNKS